MALKESYFYNAALHYLQRYASSAENLRRVLHRKAMRKKLRGEEIPEEATLWIEKAVEKCISYNYVDDRIFAASKAQSMRRQGKPSMVIARTLQQKGIENELISEIMGEPDPEIELAAAIRTVERKRLGRDTSPEGRQKDLAKLCRAGFSFQLAKAALEADSGE